MVSAQENGQRAFIQGILNQRSKLFGRGGDLRQITGARIDGLDCFGRMNMHVARVGYFVPEESDRLIQPGDSNGGRSHVDATAPRAQIHRNADYPRLLAHNAVRASSRA
jgi:hypothetical protein